MDNSERGLLKYENLKITKHEKEPVAPDFHKTKLLFGRTFAPYMVVCDWDIRTGWGIPEIKPYGNFSLSPSCSVFHYGTECFEGMKAYRSEERVVLFRPMKNMERMNKSSKRLCLPGFPEEEVLKIIAHAVKMMKDWVPDIPDYALYIRPTMIGTEAAIGVHPSENARLFVLFCPVGGYYQGECNLLVDTRYVRAFTKGTGQFKLGRNYAHTILPQYLAKERGFNQLLWVGVDDEIQEVGTMNLFVHWKDKDGKDEVVTPSLDQGTILPGIVRDSAIKILKKWGIRIQERLVYLKELKNAMLENRVIEIFGTGTAAVICPVYSITVDEKKHVCPVPEDGVSAKLKNELIKVQRGESKEFNRFGVVVEDILKM